MIKKINGFTLVELLVAISIFAVIAVVLYTCFRSGVVSYRRISDEVDSQQKLRYLLGKIEKDLKNAFFITNVPFEGEDNRISFTSVITDAENASLNTGRISYYLKQGDDGYILIRKTESLQEALTLPAVEYDTETETPPDLAPGREEVIAGKISRIRFTYLYAENRQSILGVEKAIEETSVLYEWIDLWEEMNWPS